MRNKSSVGKLAIVDEEIKRMRFEVNEMRSQKAEDVGKLEFAGPKSRP